MLSCNFVDVPSNAQSSAVQYNSYNPTISEDSSIVEYYRNNPPYYLLTLQIYQTTFTLDVGEHIKNKANKIELVVAVDKRFYDSVKIGQEISNEWKTGSMIFDGDFSKLKVKIADKRCVSSNN
jgi:hypothetical protein